jgi:AbrB family looped-hinge helix DNA binding protein
MALVRLKRAAQITLPAELRKRFHLEEGDYSFQEKDFLARST